MSFQAYLQNITNLTKQTPETIREAGIKKGILVPGIKASEFLAWLHQDYQLGRGHGMALWKWFIEKNWIVPAQGTSTLYLKTSMITVKTLIQQPIEQVWTYWTTPEHIIHWNFASSDWHCPRAKNTLRKGGKFNYHMASKDGNEGFDFEGTHHEVIPFQSIYSTLADGRTLRVTFQSKGKETEVTEIFQAETMNPLALQRQGWQSILNQFKSYCESPKSQK